MNLLLTKLTPQNHVVGIVAQVLYTYVCMDPIWKLVSGDVFQECRALPKCVIICSACSGIDARCTMRNVWLPDIAIVTKRLRMCIQLRVLPSLEGARCLHLQL